MTYDNHSRQSKTLAVGIPVYNEERNITSLLDSILKQRFSGAVLTRIIIYDDLSVDKTYANIKQYMKQNHAVNIVLRRASKNEGKCIGLNHIFEEANEDILLLLDSDVILESEGLLQRLVRHFVQTDSLGLTNGRGAETPINGAVSRVFEFSRLLITEIARSKPYYGSWGGLMALHKDLYKNVKFEKGMHRLDAYLYLRNAQLGLKYVYDPTVEVMDTKDFRSIPVKKYFKIQQRSNSYPDNFNTDFAEGFLNEERQLTPGLMVKSYVNAFVKSPLNGSLYLILKTAGLIYNNLLVYKAGSQWRA